MIRLRTLLFALLVAAIVLAGALAIKAQTGAHGSRRSEWIVPGFALTREELGSMIAPLPEDISARIQADPAGFMDLVARVLDQPPDYFTLVDKSHPLPDGYVPPDLVSLNGYPLSVNRRDLRLRASIMPSVVALSDAARRDGVTLLFSSTYRSFATQAAVYRREVALYGRETADRESAVPGLSQHQLGTAIDFGSISDDFTRTKASAWLVEHAWEYGFSLSYPEGYESLTGYRYESWHYRYITPAGTRLQRAFFDDVQQDLLQFLHDNESSLLARRDEARAAGS